MRTGRQFLKILASSDNVRQRIAEARFPLYLLKIRKKGMLDQCLNSCSSGNSEAFPSGFDLHIYVSMCIYLSKVKQRKKENTRILSCNYSLTRRGGYRT